MPLGRGCETSEYQSAHIPPAKFWPISKNIEVLICNFVKNSVASVSGQPELVFKSSAYLVRQAAAGIE